MESDELFINACYEKMKKIILPDIYSRNPHYKKLYPFESFELFNINEKYRDDALYIRPYAYSEGSPLFVSNGLTIQN